MRKRVLSLCMALTMCLSLLPIPVSAEDKEDMAQNIVQARDVTEHKELDEPASPMLEMGKGESNLVTAQNATDEMDFYGNSEGTVFVESNHPHSPELSEMATLLAMDELDEEFAILLSASDRGDTYPDKYKNKAKDAVVDEWNFYNRECTSFVAWCLNSRNGIKFTNQYGGVARWGNAKEWGGVAKGLGYSVNSTPAVGAVAWRKSGTYGHVAWVSAVSGDNVTIEEYNNDNTGYFNRRTVSKSSF